MRRMICLLAVLGCDDGGGITPSDMRSSDAQTEDAQMLDSGQVAFDAGADAVRDAHPITDALLDLGTDAGPQPALTPLITEVLASNRTGLEDEDGDRPDWIELYNPHPTPIALGNLALSDGGTRWQLPDATLDPFAYRVVFASGKNRRSDPWHANFRVSSAGETIRLMRADGTVVDRIETPALQPDQAFGRPAVLQIAPDAAVRYQTGALPDDWTEPDADDSDWARGAMGIGTLPDSPESALAHQAEFLLADWRFEGDGDGVVDRAQRHPGRLEAGAIRVPDGRVGSALGGAMGWMAADHPERFDFAEAFTWSLWLRGVDDSGALISRNPAGGEWNQGSKALFVRNGAVQWDSGWVGNPDSRVDVTDDVWHHVAVTYTPVGDAFVLYVDGVPQVETVFDVDRFAEDLRHNGGVAQSGLFVGQAHFTGGLPNLDKYGGRIDDVSLWSTALPPEDIALLAAGEPPGPGDLHGARRQTTLAPGTPAAALRIAVPDGLAPHLGAEVDPGARWWMNGREREPLTAPDLTWQGVSSAGLLALAVDTAPAWFIRLRIAALAPDAAHLAAPTPGAFNARAISPAVTFSQIDTVFSAPFDLVMRSTSGVVHYTLDGQVPTINSPIYAAPLRIAESTQVTARVFEADKAPGRVGQARFVRADPTFIEADRPLPVLVLARLDQGAATRTDSPALLFEFAPRAEAPTRTSPIAMRIRGQSSANQPKRPYRIELQDATGADHAQPLLNLPAEADWVLHAPFTDQTLIRNALVYELGRALGMTAPAFAFCEVFVQTDGEPLRPEHNQGVYLLVERIEPDTAGLELSPAGRLLKFEADVAQAPIVDGYRSLEINRPRPILDDDADRIADFLARFEAALNGDAFADPVEGYAPFIDDDSFINQLIINELVRDQDAYVRSAWLHFEPESPIVMGPLWDYNLSMGTGGFFDNTDTTGWQWQHPYNQGEHGWFARLMADPAFAARFATRWQILRNDLLSDAALMNRIDVLTDRVAAVAARNFEVWDTLGRGRVNGFATPDANSWPGQIDALKNWLRARTAWIDRQIADGP